MELTDVNLFPRSQNRFHRIISTVTLLQAINIYLRDLFTCQGSFSSSPRYVLAQSDAMATSTDGCEDLSGRCGSGWTPKTAMSPHVQLLTDC